MITLDQLKALIQSDSELNQDKSITSHYNIDPVTNKLKMEYYDKVFGRRQTVFILPLGSDLEITYAYYQILKLGNIADLSESEADKLIHI